MGLCEQRIAEREIKAFVDRGGYLAVRNPDGTTVRLQPGFAFEGYELAVPNEYGGFEQIDLNRRKR